MGNFTLNLGGFFGALAGALFGGGGVTFICFTIRDPSKPDDWAYDLGAKALVWGAIGGAAGGNFLWAKLYPPPEPPEDNTEETERYS